MNRLLLQGIAVSVCALFLVGCAPESEVVRGLQEKNSQLSNDAAQLRGENTQLRAKADQAQRDVDLAKLETESWKSKYAAATSLTQTGSPAIPAHLLVKFMEIAEAGEHWEYKGGVLRAQSDILFASGKADLKPEAQAVLAEVTPKLKEILADKSIVLRVDGHTDSDPIVHSNWKDNLQLSLERARAVATALKEHGLPPASMFAAGFGEHRPIPGATKDQNRRVELRLVPASTVSR